MDLIARKAFSYAGLRLQPGDSFQASARDARVLLAIGRVDRAAPMPAELLLEQPPAIDPSPVAAESLFTEAAEPAPAATEPAELEAPKPRRQYRRRDLTAES